MRRLSLPHWHRAATHAMTEADVRAVLLARSLERAGVLAPDDAAWAGSEARRQLGEAGAPAAWLARRARLVLARLGERQQALQPLLHAAVTPAGAMPALLLLGLALALGLFGESLGHGAHINLLALPLLGLLAWNIAVYALLLVQARRAAPPWRALARKVGQVGQALARLQVGLARRWHGAEPGAAAARTALLAYSRDWLAHSAPLQAARGTAALHGAAAALAAGAVLGLYARGLVFDYQAGWDSTFLQPAQVHGLLQWLLGPASALAGLPLPGAGAIAGLRLATGGGESAAPWIHRWAITLVLLVLLPRAGLAALALRRARQLARTLPLPPHADLQQLLRSQAAAAGPDRLVLVLPYNLSLDAAREAALAPALATGLQTGLETGLLQSLRCAVQPGLAMGAEDDPSCWLPALQAQLATATGGLAPTLVLLFALGATPERESHGAVLQLLIQALGQGGLRVAIDESGFRQRLAGADAAQRLAQRRNAWLALLQAQGVVPAFIDLSSAAVPPQAG